ncbi:MAG TPA: hypothetical protein VNY05_29760 [Candidatus Acidoferrales bacterium]|nr:hypothetical protein [Candidatus Acidoferrales bacterium]
MDRKFTVYLSHSWQPRDVELNVWVWEHLAERCDLLVDKPDSQVENPPYYVNRLEEIMRRSDIFVAILTFRPNSNATSKGDHAVQCSPGSLFEIRLAERAHRPRLVLYERTTRFQRSSIDWPGAKYIPFDRGAQSLPEALDSIEGDIERWLEWVDRRRKPRFLETSDRSVTLLPQSADSTMVDQLRVALREALFPTVEPIEVQARTDAELIHQMRNAGLVIADVTAEGTRELYAIAHALFLPAIRLAPDKSSPLPWILEGHPGGYQHDIVAISGGPPWPLEVTARANAIFRVTEPLGLEAGRKYIKSRRYKGAYVFLSHNLRPEKREFLDLLIQSLRDEQIEFFEYYRVNKAGIEWRPKLEEALGKTTLFAGLLADGYEDSDVCLDEWKAATDRNVPILSFLVNGRTSRTNLIRKITQTLDSDNPAVNAKEVFDQIKAAVTQPL